MAQDLGVHRELANERERETDADHIELRRRVWGGCLVADRWLSAIVRLLSHPGVTVD
jgi:Fungal specific transcription factor domain